MPQPRTKKASIKNGTNGSSVSFNINMPPPSEVVNSALLSRAALLSKALDTRRDIDTECGYPKIIEASQYRLLFDREGVATRIINLFPEACWAEDPQIEEGEDIKKVTELEKAWKNLETKFNIFHYLERADVLSGIGCFGIILLGLNDGKELKEPVDGINEKGEKEGKTAHKLVYLRTFDESVVSINTFENDKTNPRYGHPLEYKVEFRTGQQQISENIHWTRVIHLADNRTNSEVYGSPRCQAVYNRVYDIRKVLSGSGEMFWKGAFPGYSFEVNPNLTDVSVDQESLRKEIEAYSNGLQRYISLIGLQTKSLAPQVADPTEHIMTQLKVIALAMGVPFRIFIGTEEAKLASSQDVKNFNRRIRKRQQKYLGPMVVRPFVDRLINLGVLPGELKEDEPLYNVIWPDLDEPSESDKAIRAKTQVEAMARYMVSGAQEIMPPKEFLVKIMCFGEEEADAILEAANDFLEEQEEDEEELMKKAQALPTPPAQPAPGTPPNAPPTQPA